ncbi:MAG: DUF45 domain-containing protein [bacterium]|nr:DUF45 domain-containing protein [bacterium]
MIIDETGKMTGLCEWDKLFVFTPTPLLLHELAHLEEKNHSKIFWNKIRAVFPDYKDRMKWLKENERLMFLGGTI